MRVRHGGGARRTGPTELQRRHRLVVHVAPQHRPSPCWPAAVDLVLRQWQRERVEEAVESAAKGHRPASNRSAASQCPAAATRGNNKTRRHLTLYCAKRQRWRSPAGYWGPNAKCFQKGVHPPVSRTSLGLGSVPPGIYLDGVLAGGDLSRVSWTSENRLRKCSASLNSNLSL